MTSYEKDRLKTKQPRKIDRLHKKVSARQKPLEAEFGSTPRIHLQLRKCQKNKSLKYKGSLRLIRKGSIVQ